MPDNQFLGNTFALHMPLAPDPTGQALDLLFEVISFDGPVQRELVLAVAVMMMEYSMRGFCGIFNARMSRGPGGGAV